MKNLKQFETNLIDKHKIYLKMAKDYALMSKCRRIKVGCMIVNNGRIVSTGVNGTPKGTCNCSDHFYAHDDDKFSKENSAWSRENEILAEMNALLYAAKSNVEVTSECVIYCTHEPCNNCLKHIAVTGIKKIYYIEKYYGNTENCKYKIDIQQLDIDEHKFVPTMVANEVLPVLPITSQPSPDLYIDFKYADKHPQVKIILNARSKYWDMGNTTFEKIVECEFPLIEPIRRRLCSVDYKLKGTDTWINVFWNDTLPIEEGIQIRCSATTPGFVDDGKAFGIKISD